MGLQGQQMEQAAERYARRVAAQMAQELGISLTKDQVACVQANLRMSMFSGMSLILDYQLKADGDPSTVPHSLHRELRETVQKYGCEEGPNT